MVNVPRDDNGRFLPKEDPPLIEVKVTNPVTYLKRWWSRVMSDEGVDIRFRIHPLTAVVLTAVAVGAGFGIGRITLPPGSPIIKYVPQLAPTPSPNPWRDTAYTGVLRYSTVTTRYYLESTAAEAITLEVPTNINLAKLVGKRIFAAGSYNVNTKILKVADASDLEILPTQIIPLPTLSPQPSPTP